MRRPLLRSHPIPRTFEHIRNNRENDCGRAHLEGITLSSAETLETTPQPEEHTHADHEGHAHNHDHEHSHEGHQHGPTLNPDLTREVEVEVPADEVARSFRTVVKRYQKQARIPGFRAGKVPETLIRSRFADGIRQDVVESVLPDHFRSAIQQQNVKPISQPQVTDLKLEDGQPLKFKAVFEVLPEFSIDGYKQIKVDKADTTLTEEEFNAERDRVRDSRSTMEPVTEDRALVDGDWAQITFQGDVKGEAAEVSEAPAQPIEGQDVMIEVGGPNTLPSVNEALRGSKPGQELKFEVSYPADFGEKRLAGKTIAYQIEVKAIKRKVLPELNDEFAKELGDFETIDAFKSTLREQAGAEKRRQLESAAKDALMNALVERFQFV